MPTSSTETSVVPLFRLMGSWHTLLSQWARDGRLAAAAEDALVLRVSKRPLMPCLLSGVRGP